MKEFIEKYKTDSKYKAKIQLIGYTIFVIVVSIFALSGYKEPTTTNNDNKLTTYNYKININLNDNLYHYYGTKEKEEIIINKVIDENQTLGYSYKDNNYYRHENDTYVVTTEEEIYDVIEFNYLSLDTIDKYLNLSTKKENENIVYLKDIIIGNSSEEYITILKEENKYNIDYTSLMKLFDNSIEKLTVEIIIE